MKKIQMICKSVLLLGGLSSSLALAAPKKDTQFFDGKTLQGWNSPNSDYWSVKDGVIIGETTHNTSKNQFLWSDVLVGNFYLALDVRLTPADLNGGIQFRSYYKEQGEKYGQAYGYQADAAGQYWGTLYHEHGRGPIDWSSKDKNVAKDNAWNRMEILAVDHYIWITVNGKITSAVYDPTGEVKGQIALQIHSGPPMKIEYRISELVHNPEIKTEHQTKEELLQSIKKEVAPALQPIAANPHSKDHATDSFALKTGDTVAILGGSNAYKAQNYGWIESYLSAAYPEAMVKYRNMAWPTDTVFQQQRPRNFYSTEDPSYGEKDQRSQIKVDKLFLWFGKLESLEGAKSLEKFKQDYTKMVQQAKGLVGEVVLITPVAYSDPLQLGINVKQRNDNLTMYVDAIKQIAKEQKIQYVDLFSTLPSKELTSDGILLSSKGQQVAAQEITKKLSGSIHELTKADKQLRKEIISKNLMWQHYWVPANWAFLYGNRQTVSSSRLHTNPSIRWFPEEVEEWLVATEKKEQAIFQERK